MEQNLPYLNQERLNIIFDHVYNIVRIQESDKKFDDEKLNHFLAMLKSMQDFNYHYRSDDLRNLFGLVNLIFSFEINSEGTSLWLSLILAIKELYGFSDKKLLEVVEQISIRK